MSAILLSLTILISSSVGGGNLPSTAQANARPSAAAGQDPQRWNTYANARFDYSISYPSALIPQGESANSDGQVFLSRDSTAELRVWGSHNALNETLSSTYDQVISEIQRDGGTVSYKVLRSNFFVVSGTRRGKVVYRKTILRRDVFKSFTFEYPQASKGKYDSITARIAGSFRG